MRTDLEQKQTQREQVIEEQRLRKLQKEGVVNPELGDVDADQEGDDGDDADMEGVVGTSV